MTSDDEIGESSKNRWGQEIDGGGKNRGPESEGSGMFMHASLCALQHSSRKGMPGTLVGSVLIYSLTAPGNETVDRLRNARSSGGHTSSTLSLLSYHRVSRWITLILKARVIHGMIGPYPA